MEIMKRNTAMDIVRHQHGVCYRCELNDIVEVIVQALYSTAVNHEFAHLFDRERTQDEVRAFCKRQLSNAACDEHYKEPLVHKEKTLVMDRYQDPLDKERNT